MCSGQVTAQRAPLSSAEQILLRGSVCVGGCLFCRSHEPPRPSSPLPKNGRCARRKHVIGGGSEFWEVNALHPEVITPFVGCSASPRGRQSSLGHTPREHNCPLRRPGRCRRREPLRQVVCQAAVTAFGSHRCRQYRLHLGERQRCIATSRRGGPWGAACDTPGVAADTSRGCRAPGAAPLHVGCAGHVPQRTQGCPQGPGHLPVATASPWQRKKVLAEQGCD